MKVINIEDLRGTNRATPFPCGMISNRFLLKSDGMGFTLTVTEIPKSENWRHWHYKHHLEACYCSSGKGILHDLETNEKYDIIPGVMYALDEHDNHSFLAIEDTVLVCVFSPPLTGDEVHGKDGSYRSGVDPDQPYPVFLNEYAGEGHRFKVKKD